MQNDTTITFEQWEFARMINEGLRYYPETVYKYFPEFRPPNIKRVKLTPQQQVIKKLKSLIRQCDV